jgi:outer membrane protein assembly factor BamE (lipoprotein component of BamABCDE complex)
VPREDWQRKREFLRYRFSDVDYIIIQRLESRLVWLRSDFRTSRFGRTIDQPEAVGYCTGDWLQSDDTALNELSFESGLQHDQLVALAAQLDGGVQTIEGEEVEATGKFLTLARRRFDLLVEWGGAHTSEGNKPGEFGYDIGHCDPSVAQKRGSRSVTGRSKGFAMCFKAARDVDKARLSAKSDEAKMGIVRTASTKARFHDSMFHQRAILVLHRSMIFSAILGIGLVAGCAASVEQRGNLPTQDKIAEVHPGSTTKDEVIKILGSPSSVGIFNDKSWYYISRRTGQFAFFDPNVLDQQVYILNFDDQGVVKAVDHKVLEDGKEIVPVARTTPAPGRELSFLEQVIGNLGKFNKGTTGGESGGGSSGTGPTGRPQ